MKLNLFLLGLILVTIAQTAVAQTREEKVRADKAKIESEGFWLYNDFDAALAEGKKTGKPLLVALRCLPCEECVKLDDDLIDNDPAIQDLLKKFVCVRIVGTNGLDLDIFQYDTDQSFAMFMLNADKTIYGRFGTRSHRTEWLGDVSIEGMAEALRGALALHSEYPANKSQLEGKTGEPLEYSAPEKFPSLSAKYTDRLDYENDVVKSCIHCHQIGDARREYYWHRNEPIPDKLLFPYPHPKSIGMILDPHKAATIKAVGPDSPAEESGLKAGDQIVSMNGQPLLSMADVQWVLHNLPSEANTVQLKVKRENAPLSVGLALPNEWRALDDTDWRVSSWLMCRMALGGMRLDSMNAEQRKEAGIADGMALKVRSMGRYNAHATARRNGFKEGDIIRVYDGQTDFKRESDLFAYAGKNLKAGQRVSIKVLRQGSEKELKLPIQK